MKTFILLQFEEMKPGRDCALECGPDKTCFPDTCCASKKPGSSPDQPASPEIPDGIRQRISGATNSASIEEVAPEVPTAEAS